MVHLTSLLMEEMVIKDKMAAQVPMRGIAITLYECCLLFEQFKLQVKTLSLYYISHS